MEKRECPRPRRDPCDRRATDRQANSPTLVGAGSMFVGDLECGGDLVVGGHMRGDGAVRGASRYRRRRWEGQIQASSAMIAGEIEGSISVRRETRDQENGTHPRRGPRAHHRSRSGGGHRRRHGRHERRAGGALRGERKDPQRTQKRVQKARVSSPVVPSVEIRHSFLRSCGLSLLAACQTVDPLRQQRDARRVSACRTDWRHAGCIAAADPVHHD